MCIVSVATPFVIEHALRLAIRHDIPKDQDAMRGDHEIGRDGDHAFWVEDGVEKRPREGGVHVFLYFI